MAVEIKSSFANQHLKEYVYIYIVFGMFSMQQ